MKIIGFSSGASPGRHRESDKFSHHARLNRSRAGICPGSGDLAADSGHRKSLRGLLRRKRVERRIVWH